MGNVKKRKRAKGGYLICKRVLDAVFSLLLLFFLALPMAIIAICIRATSEGGAIFRQERVGRNGRIFVCYKFRTMYKSAPKNSPTARLENAEKYITPIGRFLRRTSLDELPQLYNVLKGEMSLIGPRPLIGEETEAHRLRYEKNVYTVRPGLTGLAQINGRDRLVDGEKAALDALYVENISFLYDVKIFLKTLASVARRENII